MLSGSKVAPSTGEVPFLCPQDLKQNGFLIIGACAKAVKTVVYRKLLLLLLPVQLVERHYQNSSNRNVHSITNRESCRCYLVEQRQRLIMQNHLHNSHGACNGVLL